MKPKINTSKEASKIKQQSYNELKYIIVAWQLLKTRADLDMLFSFVLVHFLSIFCWFYFIQKGSNLFLRIYKLYNYIFLKNSCVNHVYLRVAYRIYYNDTSLTHLYLSLSLYYVEIATLSSHIRCVWIGRYASVSSGALHVRSVRGCYIFLRNTCYIFFFLENKFARRSEFRLKWNFRFEYIWWTEVGSSAYRISININFSLLWLIKIYVKSIIYNTLWS